MKPKKQSGDAGGGTLRQRAEESLSKKPTNLQKMSAEDIEKLVHELQVHQIELEMQNDELRRAQEEIERSRSKYSDLYDFAPVGYFTFDKKGQILEVNLTGARLLGVERPFLTRKPFNLFVIPDFLEQFHSHRLKVFKSTSLETCELQLRKKDGTFFSAHLESIPVKDTEGDFTQIRSAVTDVTERHRAEEEIRRFNDELEERVRQRAAELEAANKSLKAEMDARARLQKRISHLATFPRLSPSPVLEVNRSGVLTFVNHAARKILTEASIVDVKAFFPEDLEKILKALEHETQGSFIRLVEIKGRFFELTIQLVPEFNAVRLYGNEITKRKKMEEELLRSRDELELKIWERRRDLNKRFQEINCLYAISRRLYESKEPPEKVLEAIVGLIPSGWQYPEIACARIIYEEQEYKCPDFKETPWKQSRDLLLKGEKVGLLEVYYLEEKPASDEGPFLKEEGILLQAIADEVGKFIEARHAEQERLRLVAAMDQASESVMIIGLDGDIYYVNPAFESIHGYKRQEILGKKYEEILREGLKDESIEDHIRDCIRRGEKWAGHVTKRKDGRVIELDMTVSPVREADDRIINYLFVARDVTQEVKLQEQIHQVQKMEALGTLAGGIAHDFNNLLMSMVINTDLALMDAPVGTSMRSCLEQVLKAANIGQGMVKQIVAFSRPAQQQRYPATVASIVQEALKLIRASIPTTIEIRQNLEAQTSLAKINPDQIHQVLVNLCSNSAYAMRSQGGLLEVSLVDVEVDAAMAALHPDLEPGPYIQLTVRDTGQGINPEISDRIFEPFFTTKKRGEGSGMGLAVVHGIVKGHGGAIDASPLGQGSTFNIFFPRVEADVVPEPSPSILQPGKNERILIVDDDQPILRSLQSALERLGYRVTATPQSREAWEIFRSQPDVFDLVITDQIMPQMTGMQLAEKLFVLRKDIPVILITGFSENIDEDAAKALGIREFLLKPTNTQALSGAVRRVLDQKG